MPLARRTSRKFRSPSTLEITFLLSAILVTMLILFQHISSSEQDIPDSENTKDGIVLGIRVEELDRSEIEDIDRGLSSISFLDAWKIEYTRRFNVPLVLVSLDYIFVAQEFLEENKANQVCFPNINIRINEDVTADQNLVKEKLCNGRGANYFVNESTNTSTLLYNKYDGEYNDPYLYPFDSRSISFTLIIEALLLDTTNQEIPISRKPTVGINIISQKGRDYWVLDNYKDDKVKLTLHRPLMYPIISALMLPVIFIAILSLLFLVDDKKEGNDDDAEAGYWEVAVGILGIWSIQEVLLPDFIEGPTIVGDVILALYVFLSLIILFIFIRSITRRILKNKKHKNQSRKAKS